MSIKTSVWRWVVGGLLAMVFASGCATGPQEHRARDGSVVVNGTTYWNLGPSVRSGGINPDNYSSYRTTEGEDGTIYEESGYYITHQSGGTSKSETPYYWVHPPIPAASGQHTVNTGVYGEFGWYKHITHPPGSTATRSASSVECGAVIKITHPPG